MVEGMLERIARRDMLALLALCLVGIGIPLFMSAAAGAIGVPHNDDWVYMRAAESLYRTGNVDVAGHSAAFIGQLLMVQPLLWLSGGSLWAFTAFGLVMGLIGVASTYLLARRFVGTGSAIIVVLLVVAFPGFARETASFMTDVPACALAMLCLLLGTVWLQGDGGRVILVASLAAGLLAVSIREFAIAAPVAVLAAAWARNRADERTWLAGVTGFFAAGVAFLLVFAASIAGRSVPATPDLSWLTYLGPAFATLAAVLLPAVALAVGRRMATLSPQQIILGAGLACLLIVPPDGPLVGNLWGSDGAGDNLFLGGTRDPVIGERAWALSGQLAVFAGIVVAALALSWGKRNFARVTSFPTATVPALQIARSRQAPLVLFLIAYAAGLVLVAPLGPMFDRYLYPMVPPAAILLLSGLAEPSSLGRSRALAHGAFAWLAVSAFLIAANSFAYDAARYRAGEAAVAMGYDERTIDAGYEWVGYHADGFGNATPMTYGLSWYDDRMLSSRPCAVLSNDLLDDNAVDENALKLIRVDRSAYLQYLFFGPPEPLYLYGAPVDGCEPPPAVLTAGDAG